MSGPALRICPECGEEIGRELICIGKPGVAPTKTIILPIPKTCPFCDAPLFFREHSRIAPSGQATLTGVTF